MTKMLAYYRLYLQEVFAYRVGAFIWIIGDGITVMLLPPVWIAASGGGPIGGMSIDNVVAYYVGALVLAQFITCHMMWDIAYWIREGTFSLYLVRPFSFFWSMVADNLAWRVAKLTLFLPLLVVMLAVYAPFLASASVNLTALFLLSVVLGHLLSFLSAFSLGLIALRTHDAHAVIKLYYVPEYFLSGRLFPMQLMPAWVGAAATFTPFKWTIWFPLQVGLGLVEGRDLAMGFALQTGWIVVMALVAMISWRTGLKHYTGVGM